VGANSPAVSCVGLGRMGAGIAHNIQSKGFRLTVYNRTAEKMTPFVDAGAAAAKTLREAAANADVVITMLMDDRSVLEALQGADGILAGLRPGAIHISATTISPKASRRCAELHGAHGSHFLAAPVAGRPDMAAEGKLLTFVSGKPEIIETARPVMEAYTQQIYVFGEDPANAATMKLVGNFFVAGMLELVGEAFVFAEQGGVLAQYAGMMKAWMPWMREYIERVEKRDYGNAGFTLEAGLKDLGLILDAAGDVHAPLAVGEIVRDKLLAARARGMGEQDWCCIAEITRLEAGQKAQGAR
jgi:3-hydroxyisobutyrate dehydrogenase-like beta-hydroxyacid dehydrogenase